MSKNDGTRVTFEEDLERCISRGRRCTRDMFIRDVGSTFGKMILRDRCSTLYDLASLFEAAHYFRQVGWKICKTHW